MSYKSAFDANAASPVWYNFKSEKLFSRRSSFVELNEVNLEINTSNIVPCSSSVRYLTLKILISDGTEDSYLANNVVSAPIQFHCVFSGKNLFFENLNSGDVVGRCCGVFLNVTEKCLSIGT